VVEGDSRATAVFDVSVQPTVSELIGPVVFVGDPATYVDELTHFVFAAARHHPSFSYEVRHVSDAVFECIPVQYNIFDEICRFLPSRPKRCSCYPEAPPSLYTVKRSCVAAI